MANNQADRLRRTIEAPNGARVIMPVGTDDAALLSRILAWSYEWHDVRFEFETPFEARLPRESRGGAVFEVRPS